MHSIIVAATGQSSGGQAALAVVALIAIFVAIGWLKSTARRAAAKAAGAGVKIAARTFNKRLGDTGSANASTEVGD